MAASDSYEDESTGSSTESKPNWRRKMEADATADRQRAEAAEARLQAYERKDMFRSAGLDPEDRRVEYFVKAYDGELSVEAIRDEAADAGFLGSSNQFSSIQNDALQSEQRIAATGQGGDPVSPVDFNEQIKATKSKDELRSLWESQGYLWGAAT